MTLHAQVSADTANGTWQVQSPQHVDLWYHGLAVVGFDQQEGLPLYSADYAARVRAAKERRGIYPTPLDERAEELKKEFGKDPGFQQMHFLPLYFPDATQQEMLNALMIVAENRTEELRLAGRSTRTGIRMAAGMFDSGGLRKRLREFLEALTEESRLFHAWDYEERTAAGTAPNIDLQQRWDSAFAPALTNFFQRNRLQGGRIFVSGALGPEGRLLQGSSVRRTPHVVAVWSPGWSDRDAPLFSAVRELCFAIVDDVLRGAVPRAEEQIASGHTAVRCGSLLLEENAPELAPAYQRLFLRAAKADTGVTDDALTDAFENAFELDESVVERLEGRLGTTVAARRRRNPAPRWIIQANTQADLWFHTLAVIQADQPGPLALYSADYASRIRAVKQELGVYPTLLDSLAPDLRREIGEGKDLENLHFVPLYFPRVGPERLIKVLRAIVKRRRDDPELAGVDVRLGAFALSQTVQDGRARRLLERLVDAMEREWTVFYRDYVERYHTEHASQYAAIQSMWDSLFVPQLGPYLERRRLNAGTVFPSPALGPEGRIIGGDSFNAGDQVVAVQMPLAASGPAPTVFAFLKELCFLLIDDRDLTAFADTQEDLDDLRRRTAVRCGHLLLELYAPILVGSYRRVFLDAVGAEESSTVAAFERIYPLPATVLEIMKQRVRGQ